MRTPSLDRNSAESMLGPRATTRITIDNRSLARKWLVACGVSSTVASQLSIAELDAAYHDESDATVRNIKCDIMPATTETAPAPAPQSFDTNRIAQVVGAVLAALPPAVDQDAVKRIVDGAVAEWRDDISASVDAALVAMREELSKTVRTVRIEIKDGEITRELPDGHYHENLPELITILSQGLYPLLVGPAGSGKTTAAEQAAKALERAFYLQPAATGAHDFLGYCDGSGTYHSTPFRAAYEHGGLVCCDEFDGYDANAALTFNGAIANGHCTFPDNPAPIAKHPDFLLICCANTYGRGASRQYVGRNQMDAATLDRFPVLNWDYDEKLETALAPIPNWTAQVQAWRKAAEEEQARVIISPRASIMGGKLILAGMAQERVAEMVVWKGIDSALRSRIENRTR